MTHERELERLDPESEQCFSAMRDCVAEELQARIAFGDDLSTVEGQVAMAELIADAVLDRFTVRSRLTARYRARPSP